MHRHIIGVQAHAALRKGTTTKSHQQQHVHYSNPKHDRDHVSDKTEVLLREIMKAASIDHIWITSTVRTEHDQARIMLSNLNADNRRQQAIDAATDPAQKSTLQKEFKKLHVGYRKQGTEVLTTASKSIAAGDSADETIEAMIKTIHKVGLATVSKHAATSGRNTVDVSSNAITKAYGATGYAAFVTAAKNLVSQGRIAKFGWPNGPESTGSLFHDGACFHLEVIQDTSVQT